MMIIRDVGCNVALVEVGVDGGVEAVHQYNEALSPSKKLGCQ